MDMAKQQEITDIADLIRRAKAGETLAQYDLACYYDSEAGGWDYAAAVRWYRKAAEQGVAEAMFAMAQCYRFGEGVRKSARLERKWLLAAAEDGDAYAMCNLAAKYSGCTAPDEVEQYRY